MSAENHEVLATTVEPSRFVTYSSGEPGETPTSFEQILYRDVAIEGLSVREVAHLYGIEQSDVVASRDRVATWLMETLPRSRLTLDQHRLLIEKGALDRLDYLYSEATGAWRASRGENSVTKKATYAPRESTTTVSMGSGKASLLTAAARIATLIGKFQMQCLDWKEARLAKESSPVRACSADKKISSHSTALPRESNDANVKQPKVSVANLADGSLTLEMFSRSVQAEGAGGADVIRPADRTRQKPR